MVMNLKSITFRCSSAQLERLEKAMLHLSAENRTAFITDALENFLAFAEEPEIRQLGLFELVEKIDLTGSAEKFSAQA